MSSVGTFEAKTHLTQLLGRVAKGERIVITNRGKAVAVLVPPEPETAADVRDVIDELKAIRRGNRLGKGVTIRDLVNDGRR